MTELSFPFAPPGAPPGALPAINADEFRQLAASFACYYPGVLPDIGNALEVYADLTGPHVKVKDGRMALPGLIYENDTEVQLNVGSNTTGATRWDRVVVEVHYGDPPAANLRIISGSALDVGPTLTQLTTGVWQQPIAFLRVIDGMTTMGPGDVFLDLGRFAGPIGRVVGETKDFWGIEAAVPPAYVLADGARYDWHDLPLLRAIAPNWDPVHEVNWGLDNATGELVVPDLRGQTTIGRDGMGGTRRNAITSAWANVLAGDGGAAGTALTLGMLPDFPPHAHDWGITGKPRQDAAAQVVLVSDGDGSDTYAMPSLAWMFGVQGKLSDPKPAFTLVHVDFYTDIPVEAVDPATTQDTPIPTVQPSTACNKIIRVC